MPIKKCIFICLFAFSFMSSAIAQNLTEEFTLTAPQNKIKSIYSHINVIDARIDTTNVGVIQKGAFNRKAFLKANVSLKKQIQDLYKNMIEPGTMGAKDLLMSLRDFRFTEVTEAFTETGYCYLRADLFAKNGDFYQKIDSIDAVFTVNGMDVTKKNIRNGTDKLIDFISSNSLNEKRGAQYSYNDVLNISYVEKRKIPVYNTHSYKDGVYKTYNNFKTISPAASKFLLSRNKKGEVTKLERLWGEDSKAEVKPTDIFCVVENGKIYIATNYGFYPVEFKNDDFYFKGKAKATAKAGNVVLASAFFGIIGGLIASDVTAQFEMKIDHLNGAIVPVKQL